MKHGRLLLLFTILMISKKVYCQNERLIYKNLIKNNYSIYDIKDSTVFINYLYLNRFKDDTLKDKFCYFLKSNTIKCHRYTISTIYFIHEIEQQKHVHSSLKWSNKDSPITLEKYNLDKKRPTSIFFPFDNIPKRKNGKFNRSKYGDYKILLKNDTMILTQFYNKGVGYRNLYFKNDYKIFRIEEINNDSSAPDAYFSMNIFYYKKNCFDSINKSQEMGHYTPLNSYNKSTNNLKLISISDSIKHLKLIPDTTITIEKHKYYLLDYWYISCAPCLKLIPALHNISNLIDTNKIYILGINESDKTQQIEKFIKSKNISIPQINSSNSTLPFKITSFPTLILVDHNFKEIKRFVGFEEETTEEEMLKFLLQMKLLKL